MSIAGLAHESKPKHRARAVEAMALHICVTDKTDGFCSPRDGFCFNPLGGKPERRQNCMHAAEQLMRAMETRGLMVVWPYDRGAHWCSTCGATTPDAADDCEECQRWWRDNPLPAT